MCSRYDLHLTLATALLVVVLLSIAVNRQMNAQESSGRAGAMLLLTFKLHVHVPLTRLSL